MPWCPDCKTEYREGFSVCSDCGAALAGDYPQERQAPLNPHEDVRLVLLADAGDVVEADILRSMLEESGIPVVVSHNGAGQFLSLYMGNAGTGVSGTQLFVSTGDYSRALELLDAFYKNESFDAETDEDAAQEPDLSASEEDVARKFYSAEDTAEASGMDFATRKHIFRTGLLIVLILMGIFFLLRISGVLLWLAMSFF